MSATVSRPTTLLARAWQDPRQLKARRIFFLVHLWAGLALAIWIFLIGLSGSVLVFEEEIARALLPSASLPSPAEETSLSNVLQTAIQAAPGTTPAYITTPESAHPFFTVWMHDPQPRHDLVLTADARTGSIIPSSHPICSRVLSAVHDFHVYLFMGPAGLRVNAILSAVLLVPILTGLPLWWPGVRLWQRGLRISLRHNWRRINFDLHHAIGFWSLLWSLCWAVSGVYFGFPTAAQHIAAWFSPVKAVQPPPLGADLEPARHPTLDLILETARQQAPNAFLSGVSFPATAAAPYTVTLDTGSPGDFSHRDIVTISARSGHVLSIWHWGQNQTAADRVLWSLYGFHFGTLWGLTIKIIWALVGISLPVLAVTGVLMYWNRFLRKRLQH